MSGYGRSNGPAHSRAACLPSLSDLTVTVSVMARVISANTELSGLDLTTLQRVTDPGSHSRGIEYASSGAVTRVLWNTEAGALLGTVRGSGSKS